MGKVKDNILEMLENLATKPEKNQVVIQVNAYQLFRAFKEIKEHQSYKWGKYYRDEIKKELEK